MSSFSWNSEGGLICKSNMKKTLRVDPKQQRKSAQKSIHYCGVMQMSEFCDICKLVYSKLRSYLERGSLPSDIQKNIDEDDQYSDYTGNNTENDRRLIIKASLDIVMKRLKYLDSHNPSIYERGLICYDEPVSPFKYDIYFDGNELKDDFVNLVIIIVESSEKPLDLNRGFKRPFECENAHYTYDYQDDYNQMISER